jgi:hypothetical protein
MEAHLKKKVEAAVARDWGTPELARRFSVIPKLSLSNGYSGRVVDDTEIDRLLVRDEINSLQHSLLVALLKLLRDASFGGLKSPDLNSVFAADPVGMADRKAKAVYKMVNFTKALDRRAGRPARIALINLVLLDVPWDCPTSLADAILALQDIFGDRQRELQRQKRSHDGVPVGVDADLHVGARAG